MQHTSPYKTAADLGIKDWEHAGLIALIRPLSRNELGVKMLWAEIRPSDHFCGSAGCIGGWLHANAHKHVDGHILMRSGARELFYPVHSDSFYLNHPVGFSGFKASAPQAAQAIVNFLTLGDPKWDDVMASAQGAL